MTWDYEPMPVGVLIPTRNRPDFLETALKSVVHQTYPNLRIVVIDNGDADATRNVLRNLCEDRIAYIPNEMDIGLSGSINKGIRSMSGDVTWCTVLCDDDLLDRNFVKESLRTALEYGANSIVDCHRVFVDKDGARLGDARTAATETSAAEYIRHRKEASRQTYLTGILFRREMLDRIGGYPRFTTGMATDDAFIFALSIQDRLVWSGAARAYIRIHDDAESYALSDLVPILDTIEEFRGYCRSMMSGIAFPSEREADSFVAHLESYARRLTSNCWLKKSHDILFKAGPDRPVRLRALCELAAKMEYPFTRRVRLDEAIFRTTGIFPEASWSYRILWDLLEGNSRIAKLPRFLQIH